MKIWIILLIVHLVIGVLQKPLQITSRIGSEEATEHSHSHEFSIEEIAKMIWTGDVEHEHSHAEDPTHSHEHRHSLQTGSAVLDFLHSTFEISFPEIETDWKGFQSAGLKDPFLSEILRPPIQASFFLDPL